MCHLQHTFTGHSGKVLTAKFLHQSSKVASGSQDCTLKIWDLHSRSCVFHDFFKYFCFDYFDCLLTWYFDRSVLKHHVFSQMILTF